MDFPTTQLESTHFINQGLESRLVTRQRRRRPFAEVGEASCAYDLTKGASAAHSFRFGRRDEPTDEQKLAAQKRVADDLLHLHASLGIIEGRG